MKETIVKCYCDNCKKEISEFEYDMAAKITIRIDLPHPKGKSGDCAATEIKVCDDCLAFLGIENTEELHRTIYSKDNIREKLKKARDKVLVIYKKLKDKAK